MELSEVRKNIDRVDAEIRPLFKERMELADQVACIKAQTADQIYKPDREEAIIKKQTEGVDPKILREYTAFIKRIMEVSRKYQYGRVLEVRDCFPFTWASEAKPTERRCVLVQDRDICAAYPKNQVICAASYEEMGRLLRANPADAGVGIIERVGIDFSDELHNLLLREGLYITNSEVRVRDGVRCKIVTFSHELTVLPDHNRMKIVFACPNRSGSLGSILSMISDYGINLTEIHSRPFEDGDTWNYRFFAELNANMGERESRALLYQLSQETMQLTLLGSYHCEGDF